MGTVMSSEYAPRGWGARDTQQLYSTRQLSRACQLVAAVYSSRVGSVDIEEAQELLRRAQHDRDDATTALETAQATIESSQLIIQGIVRRFPELKGDEKDWEPWEPPERVERPRGSEAVLQILQVAENKWHDISDLVAALDSHGLLPNSANPANAVRTAVERLVSAEGAHVEKSRTRPGLSSIATTSQSRLPLAPATATRSHSDDSQRPTSPSSLDHG